MTKQQADTFDSVMVYLHSFQINFDDFGYDRICEVAEDYANEFSEFSISKLKTFY